MYIKCCIKDCPSKRDNIKLHKFPYYEDQKNKWVEIVKVNCNILNFDLNKLHTFHICHKHFEKRFHTLKSGIKKSAYPTLFSFEEIKTGIPSKSYEVEEKRLSDHTYSRRKMHYEHTYCQQPKVNVSLRHQNAVTDVSPQKSASAFTSVDVKKSASQHLIEMITTGNNCREWIKAVGNEELVYLPIEKLHERRSVCGNHFEKKYFNPKGSRLKRHAVPTLNLMAPTLMESQLADFPQHVWTEENEIPVPQNIDGPPSACSTISDIRIDTDDSELLSAQLPGSNVTSKEIPVVKNIYRPRSACSTLSDMRIDTDTDTDESELLSAQLPGSTVPSKVKILIKGDRNVGKSCLLQRLQGGPFIEDYVPTDQIQVAPIHWTYKNTDYIVKVEVWEVVDKGRTKKKPPVGLKLENQTATTVAEETSETPVLDATFLDVYKNATGVILMLDITKPWTFDYVVKELSQVPDDLPVVVLGNHCDMQHHRQVHPHHIEQALYKARLNRAAPIRYAESSMRNGFGLRLLHKFLSVPFLRLQRASLLEQLQRNQKDLEEVERELDDFQNSEESQYDVFVDRLMNKRKQSSGDGEPRLATDRAPSIVLGAGKPIVPPNVNPLLTQSLNPTAKVENLVNQNQFISSVTINPKHKVSMEMTPPRLPHHESIPSTPSGNNMSASSGALDEFYAGTLDSSFLDDRTPVSVANQEVVYETDSDDDSTNPKVIVDQDELDIEIESSAPAATLEVLKPTEHVIRASSEDIDRRMNRATISNRDATNRDIPTFAARIDDSSMESDFPLWAGDSSARRSPEGGEDPEPTPKEPEKGKKKSKRTKEKDRGDYGDKPDRKEKKHKNKKSKSEKKSPNPQQDLLGPPAADIGVTAFSYEDYDSI